MLLKILLLVIIYSLNINCTIKRVGEYDFRKRKKEIIEIAENYIINNYYDLIKVLKYKPVIKEEEKDWIVTYELPKEMIGGVTIIYISKVTNNFIKSFRTQ